MYLSLGKPKVARFTDDNHIIKDHYYYSGNDVAWNRPAMIGPKFYPYYHAQNDANSDRIEDFKVQQVKTKEEKDKIYRERVLRCRTQNLDRHAQRTRERLVIQQKSSQSNLGDLNNDDTNKELCDIIANKVNSMKYARSKEFSWNFLEKAPAKQIKQFLNPIMIKGEEEMLKVIKKRIEKEDNEKQEVEAKREKFRNKQRQSTIERHEKTFEFEQKLDTFSIRSVKNLSRFGSPSEHVSNIELYKERSSLSVVPSFTSLNKEIRLKYPSKLPRLDKNGFQSFGNDTLKLKSPVENNLQRVLDVAQSELKGTLIKNMEKGVYNSKNPFYKSLADSSGVFREALEENLKEKLPTNSSKVLTSVKLDDMQCGSNDTSDILNHLDERKDSIAEKKPSNSHRSKMTEKETILDEIGSFEKSIKTLKPRGRGKAAIEEADRVLLEIGVPGFQDFVAKERESVVPS